MCGTSASTPTRSSATPFAHTNCHQSATNAFKMVLLAEALGLHPGTTSADLAATIADPSNAERIAAGVQAQATHFDMLGLQLGYVYADGALARDGEPPAHITDPSVFEPTAEVGSRLPHGWLGDGRSTLDLVQAEGMTLLTLGAQDRWADAVAVASVPVHHVRLGIDTDTGEAWRERCRLLDGGALLVRPDQHIAWRGNDLPIDPATALATALDITLGRRSRPVVNAVVQSSGCWPDQTTSSNVRHPRTREGPDLLVRAFQ